MRKTKISVVTISYNQAEYLRQCIDSVLSQTGVDLEYVIVDPGSSDGSREIINSYGNRVIKVFEADRGPADGLNKGFSRATGDILCYLNSDDTFEPGALATAINVFEGSADIDVIYGHGWVIDKLGRKKRKCFSDPFSLSAAAYGSAVVIQPSTFFKRRSFEKVGGFNLNNKSNWDGELFIDMVMAGANIMRVPFFFSSYRVHDEGITGSGRLADRHREYENRMFLKIKGRSRNNYDGIISFLYRIYKHSSSPVATFERLFKGPIFGSAKVDSK